jgi:hypothetical protein
MRATTIISCLALAGCATTNAATGASESRESLRVAGGGGLGSMNVETHTTNTAVGGKVGFAIDRVWGPLRAAFDSLGIPVATVSAATGTMGNPSLRVRRRLGDLAVSKYINCGNVQGGQSADSYEIQLSVMTTAVPAEQGTTNISTLVEAQGRPVTIAAEYMRCTSTGLIESRLVELVNAQLHR